MKIAIVGAGIAGLACAHYLCGRHELTVFEASAHVGGHARTVRVRAGAREFAVDTGFVVFTRPTIRCSPGSCANSRLRHSPRR